MVRDPSDGTVSEPPRRKKRDYELDPETRETGIERVREIRAQLDPPIEET